MNKSLTLALIELIIKQGPETAINLIQELKISDPTPEQIKSLMVKPPEEFFKD